MIVLLTAVLLGIGFTFLAIQNTTDVSLRAGNYFLEEVPLFLVVMAAFFFGVFISWILGSIGWISSAMTMHGKDSVIKRKNEEIVKLQNRIQELENDNTHLEEDKEHIKHEQAEHNHEHHPGLLDKIRYRFS